MRMILKFNTMLTQPAVVVNILFVYFFLVLQHGENAGWLFITN